MTLAYHNNRDLREEYNKTAKKTLKENDPLPAKETADLATRNGTIVDEGMTDLKKAIELKPDYDDAMAYLNLLYRQKADLETSPDARANDLKQADDLVDQVKAIKQKRMLGNAPTSLRRHLAFGNMKCEAGGSIGPAGFFFTSMFWRKRPAFASCLWNTNWRRGTFQPPVALVASGAPPASHLFWCRVSQQLREGFGVLIRAVGALRPVGQLPARSMSGLTTCPASPCRFFVRTKCLVAESLRRHRARSKTPEPHSEFSAESPRTMLLEVSALDPQSLSTSR